MRALQNMLATCLGWGALLKRGLPLLGCLGVLSLQLAGCDEYQDCQGEDNALPVMVQAEPDLLYTETIEAETPPSNHFPEDGGKVTIKAWDCVDVSWWAPVPAMKIVLVMSDLNECEYYENVTVETYTCYSEEGSDRPYRDDDLDGLTPQQGDCDDADPLIQAVDANEDGLNDCTGESLEEPASETTEEEAETTPTPTPGP